MKGFNRIKYGIHGGIYTVKASVITDVVVEDHDLAWLADRVAETIATQLEGHLVKVEVTVEAEDE